MTNVLLVTSWGTSCGIAEHSKALREWVSYADPSIYFQPSAEALDPQHASVVSIIHEGALSCIDIVHLNYHRALHSLWSPNYVHQLQGNGCKVVITWHDSVGENPPDQLTQDLCDLADAFIVHERCVGLPKAVYWRMGVPELPHLEGEAHRDRQCRPILGTMGHDFPWKNWKELAGSAAEAGWGLLIYCPEMTPEHEQEIRSVNPWLEVRRGKAEPDVLAGLAQCDATAFTFTCGNSGQSASILAGVAARKPLIAFYTCRQFRALFQDADEFHAVHWVETFDEIPGTLSEIRLERFHAPMVALAERESWRHLGKKYTDLYKSLL